MKDLTQLGINQLENYIYAEKRIAEGDRQTLDEIKRNRDILQKEIDRSENNNQGQEEDLE
jgi:hypothetical protein